MEGEDWWKGWETRRRRMERESWLKLWDVRRDDRNFLNVN